MHEQAENERSFKLLQEYLGKARSTSGDTRDSLFPQLIRAYRWVAACKEWDKPSGPAPRSTRPHSVHHPHELRFVFYLRDQPTSSDTANQGETSQASHNTPSAVDGTQGAAKFRRVEINLKPPPPAPPPPPKGACTLHGMLCGGHAPLRQPPGGWRLI
eukprot:140288-Pelagomonas_calceolata.AAC.5